MLERELADEKKVDRPVGLFFSYQGPKFPPNTLLSILSSLNLSWIISLKGSEPLGACALRIKD